MRAAEEIAEEIDQVYSSGKNGIVLEMEHRQEWEPVLDLLRKNYLNGKAVFQIRYGEKTTDARTGRTEFLPALYQRLTVPRRVSEEEYGLSRVAQGSYLAAALGRLSEEAGVGLIFVENYHLFDKESRDRSLLQLLRLLKTEKADGPLILLTVRKTEALPPELLSCVHVIRGRKPGIDEIREMVDSLLSRKDFRIEENFRREIVSYLQGFQCYEIEYLFERAQRKYGAEAFDGEKKRILELIGNEKVKMLARGDLLEWKMVRDVKMANMERLARYLRESGTIMGHLEDAVRSGVDIPKGILIMGLPGTGKSLFAQYAASALKLPLIRLEMGKMMGGHVGDSERNLREAQRQAEEMAPCILWIDEIEKGFAGSGDQERGEGAYLKRMVGGFLTWLQEKDSSCYIIATANSIEGLPPEFFRKGRFDACFYTAMPSEHEVREILNVHLDRPEREHVKPAAEKAVDELIGMARAQQRFMTGADAGALVSGTFRRLYLDFCAQTEITDKKEYDRLRLADVMKEEFKNLKVFSETNAQDIVRHHMATGRSGFINASGSDHPREKTRYDERLEAFIETEAENMKKSN